ncbi:hypothetical protein Bealeia1_02041 (plasmid) [Candidatus Bealeia paramacronuclearis]|uniref:Uncharacterized protein n=1 Tax=Candidatus Bealeia paramacronuclearis TaxID=1921001 RepID=A0ABZ2C6R5_9PROT|nr:hypothetical protein [Candidatus Bealeia paramacronuclearis]
MENFFIFYTVTHQVFNIFFFSITLISQITVTTVTDAKTALNTAEKLKKNVTETSDYKRLQKTKNSHKHIKNKDLTVIESLSSFRLQKSVKTIKKPLQTLVLQGFCFCNRSF